MCVMLTILCSGEGSNFGKKALTGNRLFGYFDMGSIMEYGAMVCIFEPPRGKTNTVVSEQV